MSLDTYYSSFSQLWKDPDTVAVTRNRLGLPVTNAPDQQMFNALRAQIGAKPGPSPFGNAEDIKKMGQMLGLVNPTVEADVVAAYQQFHKDWYQHPELRPAASNQTASAANNFTLPAGKPIQAVPVQPPSFKPGDLQSKTPTFETEPFQLPPGKKIEAVPNITPAPLSPKDLKTELPSLNIEVPPENVASPSTPTTQTPGAPASTRVANGPPTPLVGAQPPSPQQPYGSSFQTLKNAPAPVVQEDLSLGDIVQRAKALRGPVSLYFQVGPDAAQGSNTVYVGNDATKIPVAHNVHTGHDVPGQFLGHDNPYSGNIPFGGSLPLGEYKAKADVKIHTLPLNEGSVVGPASTLTPKQGVAPKGRGNFLSLPKVKQDEHGTPASDGCMAFNSQADYEKYLGVIRALEPRPGAGLDLHVTAGPETRDPEYIRTHGNQNQNQNQISMPIGPPLGSVY